MLKKFEVENFKGFSKRLVFDLTARDYEFNQNLTENGIVKKAIIYGKNGVGKSTFLSSFMIPQLRVLIIVVLKV